MMLAKDFDTKFKKKRLLLHLKCFVPHSAPSAHKPHCGLKLTVSDTSPHWLQLSQRSKRAWEGRNGDGMVC